MKHVLTIHESDIYPDKAARAVVLNDKNEVALLHVTTHNYHKLPGGGVEQDEDMALALERELLEEIGCEAEVITEIGEVIEYRDRWGLKQTSHCFLARQKSEQQPPQFTQSELDEGFVVIWCEDIKTAIALLENDTPNNYDGLFIQRRDSTFLKAAQSLAS